MRTLIRSLFIFLSFLLLDSHVEAASCSVDEQLRTDCGYPGITQGQCEASGCCWSPASSPDFPWCFYGDSRTCGYYVATGESQVGTGVTEIALQFQGLKCNYYGEEIEDLKVVVAMETVETLHVKIVDASEERWEVPDEIIPRANRIVQAPRDALYKFGYITSPFGFFIQRTDTGEVLFNSSASANNPQFRHLVFENQYLEISTQLPGESNIYGLGERRMPLRLETGLQYTFWSADELTPYLENNYGSHPFYMEHRNGKSHGVFLLNSNGIDIDYEPGFLRYRVIGGVFDFYFFMGPTPNAVVSQYLSLIGNPYMIPLWSLGFHQCKWGYENLDQVKGVVAGYREANIPLETMWIDIDYMNEYRDWTFDPVNYPQAEVKAFIEGLHANNQHQILITDPGIKYESGYKYYEYGRELDIFLKNSTGDDFIGRVWPGNTVFPDFLHPRAYEYWKTSIQDFLELVPVDGLWVDMNEVANFCHGYCDNKIQAASNNEKRVFDPVNPPYKINNRLEHLELKYKTTDMDVSHYGGVLEYDAHNLYGATETMATKQALEELTGQRAFVLSRSTFPGTGAHGGHWTGDNYANWEHLYHSIPAMLAMNIFGIPYVGADICGFAGDTTEELCARWMQLGAFYPFARNHNMEGAISQEPYLWESVAEVSRIAINIRYSLLSSYYTLFHLAHTEGQTVVRPLFFEFPADSATFGIDKQFMLGDFLLFSPVLEQGAQSVAAYLPAGRWYDFYTHVATTLSQGSTLTLSAPLEKIPIHIRGGKILSLLSPRYTTTETLQTDYSLVVALSQEGSATGLLYLDDGISLGVDESSSSLITFEAASTSSSGRLTSGGRANYNVPNKIAQVDILGVTGSVRTVTLNGASVPFTLSEGVLSVKGLSQSVISAMSLSWQ